ncbi:Ankyrin repeat protein 1 [Giardia duodenalis]|uniref:Ankyrin repeat protein 1 n=1 Tax=Giardia intestinalis (strain ATCC 50803 / WB clone C6) TaxID=184922 RepID=A0A644F3Q5_GIAIC|nr:Ankyrin repeat protein 1 [Giardia intestinalis]KAE8303264.1 Ankyrin repeat protein 1 [Giardia intestinalis]
MGNREWFGAIANGSYGEIEQLTPHMAGTRNHLGETALMIAVRLGDDHAVKILEPFESTLINAQNETALMIAVRYYNIAAARLLVSAEYCISKPDGTTALHLATQLGHIKFVELLEPYLRHTADKSGALALPETRPLHPSFRDLGGFDLLRLKDDDLIVSSTIFKQRGSNIHITDSFNRHLNSLTPSKQSHPISKKSASLPIESETASTEQSLHQPTPVTKQLTKSIPRPSPHVHIEMAVIEDTMTTACDISTVQSESLKEPDLDLVACTGVDDDVTLLNKTSSAKKTYIHAQLQASQVLSALETPYMVPSFVVLPTQFYHGSSLSTQAAQGIFPLLIINLFAKESTVNTFESIEEVQARTLLALECLVCALDTAYVTDLPSIFICATPNLVSVVVPCRGAPQLEKSISHLSTKGVFATALLPPLKERYMCLAKSFSPKHLPHAGHLCDTRYICVHKITREKLCRLCRPSMTACKVYLLADSATSSGTHDSGVCAASEDALSGHFSSFLVQVSGATRAESLLVWLAFSGYDASLLSFYEFTEIDLSSEIFIET